MREVNRQDVLRETAPREHKDTNTSREISPERRYIRLVLVERRSTSREHSMVVDLRNLLKELAEARELLELESRTR